ncbi:MAG: hypothetical protein Devi2KO_40530 [Devosia indica]
MAKAAETYDLAAIKRVMETDEQISISLNFPLEDYLNDVELIEFIIKAGTDEMVDFLKSNKTAPLRAGPKRVKKSELKSYAN